MSTPCKAPWLLLTAVVIASRGVWAGLAVPWPVVVSCCLVALVAAVRMRRRVAVSWSWLGGAVLAGAGGAVLGEILIRGLYGRDFGIGLVAQVSSLVTQGRFADGTRVHGSITGGGLELVLDWGKLLLDTGLCFLSGGIGLAVWLGLRPPQILRLALVVVGVLTTKAVLATAAYFASTGQMGMSFPGPLCWFRSPGVHLATIVVLGLAVTFLVPCHAEASCKGSGYGTVVATWCWLAAAFALVADFGSPSKRLRVLVDDAHNVHWNRADRRLDENWFGDFSTYNLALACEILAASHDVVAFTGESIDSGLLAGVDVLVLKTPEIDYTEDELRAISSYVTNGGGLLLVGDHTDLMGMSGRLNTLASLGGVAFRFDAVSAIQSGGFVSTARSPVLSHPALGMTPRIELMTGCSLALWGSAQPLLTVQDGLAQVGDYTRPSYFGVGSGDGRNFVGPTVIAAQGRCGKGNVVAFSDSTILSSFAVWVGDRTRMWEGLVRLAATPARSVTLFRLGIVCLLLAAGLLVSRFRDADGSRFGPLVRVAVVGLLPMFLVVEGLRVRSWEAGQPARDIEIAEVSLGSDRAVLPPTLGGFPSEANWAAFDTFVTAIARSGRLPVVVDADEVPAARAATRIVIRPSAEMLRDWLERASGWLEAGGAMVLLVDNLDDFEACAAALPSVARTELDASGVGVRDALAARFPMGKGCVVVVTGAVAFSRLGLGHCFAMPTTSRGARYAAIAAMLTMWVGQGAATRSECRVSGG